jgi:protein TonB
MRWLVGVFLWVMALDVRAGEVFLIPEYNPKPLYPVELHRAGITGKLQVSLTVHADGSVSKVAVMEDAHPDLSEASVTAVSQWRFKPWEITSEHPAEIAVIAPIDFRLDSQLPFHANKQLAKLKCASIARAASGTPVATWVDLPVFDWTRSYLTYSLSPAQLPDEERLELINTLNASVPSIVRRCKSYPASRYVRFLPEEIRVLL